MLLSFAFVFLSVAETAGLAAGVEVDRDGGDRTVDVVPFVIVCGVEGGGGELGAVETDWRAVGMGTCPAGRGVVVIADVGDIGSRVGSLEMRSATFGVVDTASSSSTFLLLCVTASLLVSNFPTASSRRPETTGNTICFSAAIPSASVVDDGDVVVVAVAAAAGDLPSDNRTTERGMARGLSRSATAAGEGPAVSVAAVAVDELLLLPV
jgi:hypothetical protein